MTAELVRDTADDTVRRTIKGVAEGKGFTPDQVALAAGMSRSAYFRKISGHGSIQAFKAGEVAAIAQFLGVSVGQLYDGLGGTFVPPADGVLGNQVTGR